MATNSHSCSSNDTPDNNIESPIQQTTTTTTTTINQQAETARTTQAQSIDEPPPAYEPTLSSNNDHDTRITTATGIIEAPPPYCLIDPSKIRTTDRLPHYPHPSPVEIVDLSSSNNANRIEQPSRQNARLIMPGWIVSGCTMDIGTDCTFLMTFIIAFFFNWLGFLAVVCLIPTIAARYGAMSGFGLSVAKWITVMRYHEFNNASLFHGNMSTSLPHRTANYDPAQNFVFAIILFAGFFLFIRGLLSYIAIKGRANEHGRTNDIFTWY